MKRYQKVLLFAVPVGFVLGGYFAYMVYKMTKGSETLSGKRESIPEKMAPIPPLTTDAADWPNWRGSNYDGKSATTGIQTDWSKGLKKLWNVNYLCQNTATAS